MIAFLLLTHNVKIYILDDRDNLIFAAADINLREVLAGSNLDALYVIGAFSSVLNGEDAVIVGKQLINDVETSMFMLKSDVLYIASLYKLSGAKKCEIYSLIDFYSGISPSGVAVDYGSELNLARVVVSNNGKVLSSIELPLDSLKDTLASVANLNVKFIVWEDPVILLSQFVSNAKPKMYIDKDKQTFTLVTGDTLSSLGDSPLDISKLKEEDIENSADDVENVVPENKSLFKSKKRPSSLLPAKKNKPLKVDEENVNSSGNVLTEVGKEKLKGNKPSHNRKRINLDEPIVDDYMDSPSVPPLTKSKSNSVVKLAVVASLVLIATIAAVIVCRLVVAPGRIAAMESNIQLIQSRIADLSPNVTAIEEVDLWITPDEFAEMAGALDASDHSLVTAELSYGSVEATIYVENTDKYQYIYGLLLSVIEEECISAVLIDDTVDGQTYDIFISRR